MVDHHEIVKQYMLAEKEKNLRLDGSFSTDAIIFDAGAYMGDWTKKFYDQYQCNIYAFEPLPDVYPTLKARYSSIEKIKTFNYALGGSTREDMISSDNDSSSFVYDNKNIKILVKSVVDVLIENNIDFVDIFKLNVEGAEYEILDKILYSNISNKFNNFQIQFHRNIDDFENRREKILQGLSKTHKRDWNYEFVWESWSLK